MKKGLLIDRVKETLQRLIGEFLSKKKKTSILVGFSGGKDSTFLLYALCQLKDWLNLKLFAFHLNHLLRGEEAKRDERFCQEFCRKLKVPLVIKRYDVKRYAKRRKISLEEAGRVIRYRFLEEIRKKKGLDFIVLGHNATDNCETMLLGLIKGQGLSGIAGIPPTRGKIIRPLIDIKREEIEEFLKKNNIPYVFDTTNLSLSHPRNYIRHIILPFLKEVNPNLEETMRQTAQILQEEDAFQKVVAKEKIAEGGIKKVRGGYFIDNKIFLPYNLAIKRRVLKELFKKMPYEDVERVIGLVEKPSGKEVILKGGLWAVKESDGVFIGKIPKRSTFYKVLKFGVNRIEGMGLDLEIKRREKGGEIKDLLAAPMVEYFDEDEILPPLYIRFWQPGDFLAYEEGKKKLQDLFVDYKIPKRIKNEIPILFDQKGVLWVLGLRRANRAKITEKTGMILEVKIKRWKENPIRGI
ncbi:MAG: tRNA lysidine(34) synthetase TilS [candidate division WOR-3 bacterium]